MNIIWKGSPNKNDESFRTPINTVVLHWFGVGDLSSANNRFQSSTGGASAHYGISDDTVYQWVKEEEVAWHAGVWEVNQRSIGIEHDATIYKNATEQTYQTSGQLLREICDRHNIPLDREHIIKHSEVKPTQCPGTLDVDKIISIAKGDSMSLTQDIGTEVEEKFGLKEVDRYNKYWSYEELIADWVKLYAENITNEAEKEKYKTEARESRDTIAKLSETLNDLNRDIEALDKKFASQSLDVSQMRESIAKLTTEKDDLDTRNKALLTRVEHLEKENADLYSKMASNNPIEKYETKELIVEVVDRFFRLFQKRG
jgi:N-acetyl-anhydromuramyl-L-alanine amidase AmpD